jgi:TorA maturation chaperone TorD
MLYHALFGREPDAPGLAFWVAAMRDGATLEHVADEFMHSAEIVGHALTATQWDFLV